MDEIFFFQYHMKMNKTESMKLQIMERRYLIDKYVTQKENEQREIEKQSKSKGRK